MFNTKCTMRKRHEEHKVKNTKQVMPQALLRMQVVRLFFQIPQVFAFVFFFVTISPCVLCVKILTCQWHMK
jgi:hypothetical protein